MHNRILIADNSAKRGWETNPICSLRGDQPESTICLILRCAFAKEIKELEEHTKSCKDS
uniref:Uncharacterized protein n=1 Tax=Arundo donax TaxID=35708 RepID=A0A0A9EJA9_ARUDO